MKFEFIFPVLMFIVIFFSCWFFISMTSNDKKEKLLRRSAVSVEYIRNKYFEQMINKMKNNQIFGDAEMGITGQGAEINIIREMGEQLIPPGHYVEVMAMSGEHRKRQIENYTYVWGDYWHSYYKDNRQISRRQLK